MGVYQQLFDDEENRKMLEKAYAKIGMEEGRQQGLEEGRREGLEQGRTLERETIIKGMLSKNLSPEDISEMTDLPLDYIAGIASESEKNPSRLGRTASSGPPKPNIMTIKVNPSICIIPVWDATS